jgi:hypothetical protein
MPKFTDQEIERRIQERKAQEGPDLVDRQRMSLEKYQEEVAKQQAKIDDLAGKLSKRSEWERSQGRALFEEAVKKYGIEPIDELLRLVAERDPETGRFVLPPNLRIKVLLDLLDYRMPKSKAVESVHEGDYNYTVVIQNFGDSKDGKLLDITPKTGGGR